MAEVGQSLSGGAGQPVMAQDPGGKAALLQVDNSGNLKTTGGSSGGSSAGTLVAGTIAAGGTAQAVFGVKPTNGWEIINTHATETLYVTENGTPTVADNGAQTAIAPKGSYTTPTNYAPTGDVQAIATTTGHAFIARRW